MGEDPRTAAFGKAHQIDGDIDFNLPHGFGNFGVAFSANIDEPVKGPIEARPHRTAVVGTERYRNRFETGSVMFLKHTDYERGQSVGMKIRRHISEADRLRVSSLFCLKNEAGHDRPP
jgi:hypothetical protein